MMANATQDVDEDLSREREFAFNAEDFRRVCELIYERAGIALSESKQDLAYGRLARRLRTLGLRRFSSYLDLLEDPHAHEWEHFTNALTTNLTSFFRERHHFEMLEKYIHSHGGHDVLRVWSAAASTGEEPYSIALSVAKNMRRASDSVRILATDIDTNVLAHGRAGVYPLDRIDGLEKAQQQKYFLRGKGAHAGQVRVIDQLRNMISFRRLNLLDAQWPMRHRFDVVFCRNVLIYFDKPTQKALMQRLAQQIKPGGLLFIGHSENPPIDRQVLDPLGRTAYRVLRASHE